MNKLKEKYIGSLNVLKTFPNTLINYAITDIVKYVDGLEEIRMLDNKIITQLHNQKTELVKMVITDLKFRKSGLTKVGWEEFKKMNSDRIKAIENIIEFDIDDFL